MTEGLDLDALREDARQGAAGIPLLADALLEASTRRLLVSGTASPDLLLPRSGRFGLRFYLSKQRKRIRLFRSRDEAPQMVLDAGVSLRIEPLRDEDPEPRSASAPQRCTLSLPSFLVVRPTREELAAPGFLPCSEDKLPVSMQAELENRLAERLSLDSLTYLTVDGLRAAFPDTCCAACFDGTYPLQISEQERKWIEKDRRSCYQRELIL